jgi:hypothetical protein
MGPWNLFNDVLLEDRTPGRRGEPKSELAGEVVNMAPEEFFV